MRYFHIQLLFVLVLSTTALCQSTHPGIDLYKAGKNAEAARSLSQAVKQKPYETNADVWNFLGLAHLALGEIPNGRKAFEKAVKIDPANVAFHVNLAYAHLLGRSLGKAKAEATKAIEIEPKNAGALVLRGTANFLDQKLDEADLDAGLAIAAGDSYSQAYVLKSSILMARLADAFTNSTTRPKEMLYLEDATRILKLGEAKCLNADCRKDIKDELERVEPFYLYFTKNPSATMGNPPTPEPDVTPLKIIKKAAPSYTEAARRSGISGTIRVAVLFAASGKIDNVLVLRKLDPGLDQMAIRAARLIQFEPMRRNGTPVPVVKIVEYTFEVR